MKSFAIRWRWGFLALALLILALLAVFVVLPRSDIAVTMEEPETPPVPETTQTVPPAAAPALPPSAPPAAETSAPRVVVAEAAPPVVPAEPAPTVVPAEPAPTAVPAEPAPTVVPAEPAPTVVPAEPAPQAEIASAAPSTAPPAPAAVPIFDLAKPSIDLVRMKADGSGLVAGRAEPGAKVRILLNGVEIAEAVANDRGEFVAFVQTDVVGEGQILTLATTAHTGEEISSTDQVLILPVPRLPGDDTPQAPAIVNASDPIVRVMQPAGLAEVTGVTLDSISYDDAGEVILAGRGRAMRDLQIYVDDTPVLAIRVSDGGSWSAKLFDLKAGRYVLRIDELSETGSVSSRVESPFQRLFPEAVVEAMQDGTAVTIQPGNTLWVLARDRYGSGLAYTQIFAANKDQIRDPDLIYPGQIFTLPEAKISP